MVMYMMTITMQVLGMIMVTTDMDRTLICNYTEA